LIKNNFYFFIKNYFLNSIVLDFFNPNSSFIKSLYYNFDLSKKKLIHQLNIEDKKQILELRAEALIVLSTQFNDMQRENQKFLARKRRIFEKRKKEVNIKLIP